MKLKTKTKEKKIFYSKNKTINKLKTKIMLEILKEQLNIYLKQKKELERECITLMREGKQWKELAKKVAGLNMLIETTLIEIKKWS